MPPLAADLLAKRDAIEVVGGAIEDARRTVPLHAIPLEIGEVEAGGNSQDSHPISLDQISDLAGTYIDAVITLGQQRYLFSSDILRVLPATSPDESFAETYVAPGDPSAGKREL